MGKHTPGPWEAVTHDDQRGQPVPYYRGLICTVEHNPDRYLSVVASGGRTSTREQWQANVHLIAAAPCLLAALKLLHDNLAEYQRINNLGGYDNQDMRQARAAIARAKGE